MKQETKLEKALLEFKNSRSVTFLSPKELHHNEKMSYYALLFCLGFASLYELKERVNNISDPSLGDALAIPALAIGIYFVIRLFVNGYQPQLAPIQTRKMQRLQAPITESDINELQNLMQTYQVFLDDEFNLQKICLGQTTPSQLGTLIDAWIKKIHSLSEELDEYLKKERFSNKKVLGQADFAAMKIQLARYTEKTTFFYSSTKISQKKKLLDEGTYASMSLGSMENPETVKYA